MVEIVWREMVEGKQVWHPFNDLDMTWQHFCDLFGLFGNKYAVRVKADSGYIVNQVGLRKSYKQAGYKCSMLADMANQGGLVRDWI